MPDPICTIEGCDKPPRSSGSVLCKMHYHRQYRHGSVHTVSTGIHTGNGRRYQTRYMPRHPLATKTGKVYIHRQVLYDEIGDGPHACHWCGIAVNWGPKGAPDELQPDHLNSIGDDNRLENLVPACRRCNALRGNQARSRALRDAGWWSNHDTIARLRSGGRADSVETDAEFQRSQAQQPPWLDAPASPSRSVPSATGMVAMLPLWEDDVEVGQRQAG